MRPLRLPQPVRGASDVVYWELFARFKLPLTLLFESLFRAYPRVHVIKVACGRLQPLGNE